MFAVFFSTRAAKCSRLLAGSSSSKPSWLSPWPPAAAWQEGRGASRVQGAVTRAGWYGEPSWEQGWESSRGPLGRVSVSG